MFNIFRRSKNKSKDKSSRPKDEGSAALGAEKYRPLSEEERERATATAGRRGPMPSIARAAIEELDDLRDLEEAPGAAGSGARRRGEPIYFDGEVNLASAAPNFTANRAPPVRGERAANSATGGRGLALEFGKINAIAAATWGGGAHDERGGSRNELAERQGHVSAGHKNHGDNQGNNNNNNDNDNSHHKGRFGIRNRQQDPLDAKENVEPAPTNTSTKSKPSTTTSTTTSPRAEATPAPSLHEVKYRHPSSSNSSSNSSSSSRAGKSAESKRQSWLGLALVNGRSRANAEEREEAPKKKPEPSARKSFFLGKSRSVESERPPSDRRREQGSRPNSSLFFNEAEAALDEAKAAGEERRRLRPLERSRDFLSEILMARGRNHNRNRNQQQQQQQQHRQNNGKQSASPPDASSPNMNNNNNSNSNHNGYKSPPVNVSPGPADPQPPPQPTHLETIHDPSRGSTNSYQMTAAKFSAESADGRESERRLSSDSAESGERERLHRGDGDNDNDDDCEGDCDRLRPSSRADESRVKDAPSIERNAFSTEEPQPASSARVEDEERPEGTTGGSNNNANQDNNDDCKLDQNSNNKSGRSEPSDRESSTESKESCESKGSREPSEPSAGAKSRLDELTECDRDRLLHRAKADVAPSEMGQTNGKPEPPPRSRRASTPREFRESVVREEAPNTPDPNPSPNPKVNPRVELPTITVVDYSDGSSGDGSPVEQDVFYDFESGPRAHASHAEAGVSISAVEEEEEDEEGDDCVFHEPDAHPAADASSRWQFVNAHSRLSHATLADVPEQEEEEDDDDEEEEVEEARRGDGDKRESVRSPLKSANTSDSNLSSSCPDSGIGDSIGGHSHAGSPARVLLLDSCNLQNERHASGHAPKTAPTSPAPFVRDGNSTDCDETLMQCDDFDFVADAAEAGAEEHERLVCIESISLPDVVVESTASCTSATAATAASAASTTAGGGGGDHIVNINGATGNSIGNVHFIPIHVEGGGDGAPGQKRRSLDDSVIGSGGKKSLASLAGHHARSTVEITAEEDENEEQATEEGRGGRSGDPFEASIAEKLKRDLVNQESRFSAQLDDAQKNAHNLQAKVSELQTRIEDLEKDLAIKTWNVERLQGELGAAHKDDEYVRKRLKLLEDEKTNLRHQYCDNEEELQRRYEELEQRYKELEEKFQQTQHLASNLQTQLAAAQSEAEARQAEVEQLRGEMEEQMRILRNALENSEAERKISEDKWQKEFEMLRNHNQEREESLMTDCEWQLRQMQKSCKDKIDKVEHSRREALERAETLEAAAQERLKEVQDLRSIEAEARLLRGLTTEQKESIVELTAQIEALKGDLQTANENLEDQIEAVRKIKYQCDNKIYDKERELIQRIDDVRNEAAAFWENKLYTEMTRLKSELESVFVDDRREALDKLQAEHIEELRALTTRYTANEEELRAELAELQERLERRNEEFLELREKSDSALLQTRMHLDRADREYQTAMCREEERREALEQALRKEFEEEKLDMEEKFRERLGQVKDEFARELQMSTQEMAEHHRKELEQQKAKLQAERDEAMQEVVERHRQKMAAAEDQMKDIELRHNRDLKDLKAAYDAEKVSLDKRDISNANEIEQLHRKCRCLTNLFEEMRMRYERRDPRPEDLREIAELRSRCEAQERDLYLLTDRLREMQIRMEELQQQQGGQRPGAKAVKKPPPKTIPTNCDVIYEENEERDSPPPSSGDSSASSAGEKEEEDDDEGEDEEEEETINVAVSGQKCNNNKDQDSGKKRSHLINEDDGHMITAM